MNQIYVVCAVFLLSAQFGVGQQSLYISGLIDGPLAGGTPKAVQICAKVDVSDLSHYGLGLANNGGGTDGVEFILSGSIKANECIWVASEETNFEQFFCNTCIPNFTSSIVGINGDDAIELFYDPTEDNNFEDAIRTDVFGDPLIDGTAQNWEYLDGWAVRKAMGPSTTFDHSDWFFSGINVFDGSTSNQGADTPFPKPPRPDCMVSLSSKTEYKCNELVDIELDVPYEGGHSVLQVDFNGLVNIGDSPQLTAEGEMKFRVLPGQFWEIELVAPFCDTIKVSGVVPYTVCNDCPQVNGFINELNYEDPGADKLDFVELFFPISAPFDRINYSIELLNGRNNDIYGRKTLDELEPIERSEGTYFVWETPIQNGVDAILFKNNCGIIDAIAYEGSISISDQIEIPSLSIFERSDDLVSSSLQRIENRWIKASATKGSINAVDMPIAYLLDSCLCSSNSAMAMGKESVSDVLQIEASRDQVWEVTEGDNGIIPLQSTFVSGLHDWVDNDKDGLLDEQDEDRFYTYELVGEDELKYSAKVSNGFKDFVFENTCSYLKDCGEPFDFEAVASCDGASIKTYFIAVSAIQNISGYTIDSTVVRVNASEKVFKSNQLQFGPFNFDGDGSAVKVNVQGFSNGQVVLESSREVEGAICGFGQNAVYCNCENEGIAGAKIIAQATPGSFTPSPNQQWYFLLNEATDVLLDVNKTGFFEGLDEGNYKVTAINIEPSSIDLFSDYLNSSLPQKFRLEDIISVSGHFDGACYNYCGLATFQVNCPCCLPNTMDAFRQTDFSICEFEPIQNKAIRPMPIFFINEFDTDQEGRDTEEFIEILGPANTDLGGFGVLLYNGSNQKIYEKFDLDGYSTDENGLFLLTSDSIVSDNNTTSNSLNILTVPKQSWLQNGTDAIVFLQHDIVESIANDFVPASQNIIHSVVYGKTENEWLEGTFGVKVEKDQPNTSLQFFEYSYLQQKPTPGIATQKPLEQLYTFFEDDDGQLGSLIASGVPQFTPKLESAEIRYYWVQIASKSCISSPVRIRYELLNGPSTNEIFTKDGVACIGNCEEAQTTLSTTCNCAGIDGGFENISWFLDPYGDSLIHTGATFNPVAEGFVSFWIDTTYTYYVNYDCGNNCLSPLKPVNLSFQNCFNTNDCQYYVSIGDQNCDGWEGGQIEVFVNDKIHQTIFPSIDKCLEQFIVSVPQNKAIRIDYTAGANSEGHYFNIEDDGGNRILSGGTKDSYGVISNQSIAYTSFCQESCSGDIDAVVLIEADRFIENAGWSLVDVGSQQVIAEAPVGSYAGVSAGDTIRIPISLKACRLYLLEMIDTFGRNWNGQFHILSSSKQRGVKLEKGNLEGHYELFYTDGRFGDGAEDFYLNFPCLPTCEDEVIRTFSDCTIEQYEPSTPSIAVCNANNCGLDSYVGRSYLQGPQAVNGVYTLDVGTYDVVHEYTFANDQVIRCFNQLQVLPSQLGSLVCNDTITIALAACMYEVKVDDLLENTALCKQQFDIEILDQGIRKTDNIFRKTDIGKELIYSVSRIGDGSYACGGILRIERKKRPTLACKDIQVFCNHPAIYSDSLLIQNDTLRPIHNELPMPILSGTPTDPAVHVLRFNNENNYLEGDELQDISVFLQIDHSDIEDLVIQLETPWGIRLNLLSAGTCKNDQANNLSLQFADGVFEPLSCQTDSVISLKGALAPIEAFNTILNRRAKDLLGVWKIIVIDNDNNAREGYGFGQINQAEIRLSSALPSPRVESCMPSEIELIGIQFLEANCMDGNVGAWLKRQWKVTSTDGQVQFCEQNIGLLTPSLSVIVFPSDIGLIADSLKLDSIPIEVSGKPMLEGIPIEASQYSICDIGVTYIDKVLTKCAEYPSIRRIWEVFNYCSNERVRDTQYIEIKAPLPIISLQNDTINGSAYSCDSDGELDIILSNYQLDDLEYFYGEVKYVGGIRSYDFLQSNKMEGLPIGSYEVIIYTKANCSKESVLKDSVHVVDRVEPIAVCTDVIKLTLGSNGRAFIDASTLDEGSFDNCKISEILMRRAPGCIFQSRFERQSAFDCCDIGRQIRVELLVTDKYGNRQTCWSYVEVSDIQSPKIYCPPDTTISCSSFNIDNLESLGAPIFEDNCQRNVRIRALPIVERFDSSGLKIFVRSWEINDRSKFTALDTCNQIVTLSVADSVLVQQPPKRIQVYGCHLSIDPKIILNKGGCSNITISKKDQIFDSLGCMYVRRTYTVIDASIYNPDNINKTDLGVKIDTSLKVYMDDGDGYFKFNQLIEIIDTTAPVFELADTLYFSSLDCESMVQYRPQASDNCLDSVRLYYTIHKDNYIVHEGESMLDVRLGLGNYEVTWVAEDGCMNRNIQRQILVVEDTEAPRLSCHSSLKTNIGYNERLEVRAVDLVKDIEDNCTTNDLLLENIKVGLSNGNYDSVLMLSCTDIENGTALLNVLVTDASGNNSSCTTILQTEVDCPSCETSLSGRIYGHDVHTFEQTLVHANGSYDVTTETDALGQYSIKDLDRDEPWLVWPHKNDEMLKGISTLDIIYIHNHLLEREKFKDPIQMLAADIDNNGYVSSNDLSELSRVLLGKQDTFLNQSSYQFYPVSEDVQSIHVDSILSKPIPSRIYIDTYDPFEGQDFRGLKTGDVSGNTISNRLSQSIMINNIPVYAGKEYIIPIHLEEGVYSGGQLGFELRNAEVLSFELADVLKRDEANDFMVYKNQILLNFWQGFRSFEGEKIAEFKIASKVNATIDSIVRLAPTFANELYTQDLIPLPLQLDFNHQVDIVVGQNYPNPFKEINYVPIYSSYKQNIKFEVISLEGKMLFEHKIALVEGSNSIKITREQLGKAGLYYYKFTGKNYTKIQKVLLK